MPVTLLTFSNCCDYAEEIQYQSLRIDYTTYGCTKLDICLNSYSRALKRHDKGESLYRAKRLTNHHIESCSDNVNSEG